MILKNLTERILNVVNQQGKIILTLLPDPDIQVRCGIAEEVIDEINDIPVVRYNYFEVQGLPEPMPGVILVVKYAVLKALNGSRPDVVAPDTAPNSVKKNDHNGRVEGVRQFVKL